MLIFSDATFAKLTAFSNTEFHDRATFSRATFKDGANFSETTFEQRATFSQSKFLGYTMFKGVTFAGDAFFLNTTLCRFGSIIKSEFAEDVMFIQSVFETPLAINHSTFKKGIDFRFVSGKSIFLNDVNFARLPSFVGAHFDEAPQFDQVDLDPYRLNKTAQEDPSFNYPSAWRALRRLASEGHDHERELQFLKGEIIARRGYPR